MNPYSVLGLTPFATKTEIRTRFRTLSKKHHPDVAGSSRPEVDYREILEAYHFLMNDGSRSDYDRRHIVEILQSLKPREPKPVEAVLIPLDRIEYAWTLGHLPGFGARIRKLLSLRKSAEGRLDQDITISVTPLELKLGAWAQFELPARSVCPVCRGASGNCYRCLGRGFIKTTGKILFPIPRDARDGGLLEVHPVDYAQLPPLTHFRKSDLKVRVIVMD